MSGCICVDVDYEARIYPYTQKIVRARKPWKCCECGENIAVGDLHEDYRGLCDGRWLSYRTCARCVALRDDVMECGWLFGTLVEVLWDVFGFDYREGIPDDFTPCGEPSP